MTLAEKLHAAGIPYVMIVEETATVETQGLNLSDEQMSQISAIIAEHIGEAKDLTISFALPLIAPSITVSEIIVQSPKPKDKAKDALSHLVGLAKGKDKPPF